MVVEKARENAYVMPLPSSWTSTDNPHPEQEVSFANGGSGQLLENHGFSESLQDHCLHLSTSCPFLLFFKALRSLSGVIGNSLKRTPTASKTALAMAGAVGAAAGSPIPLAPKGPSV